MTRLRRQHSGASQVALAASLALFLAACGEVDGQDAHFPGTVAYDSPDGQFHFHYLSPPWVPVAIPGFEHPVFVVPPGDLLNLKTIPNEADAPYSLRLEKMAMPAAAALEQVMSTETAATPVPASAIRDVATLGAEQPGIEMSYPAGSGVFRRDAFLELAAAAGCVRMRFSAEKDIAADPMVSQMIASLAAKPSTTEAERP